jgi:hypothetical protein
MPAMVVPSRLAASVRVSQRRRSWSGCIAFHRLFGSFGRLLAPGISVDIEDMAVLDEAIDQGGDASGAWKCRAPLLERQIGSDGNGARFVSAADDIVQKFSPLLARMLAAKPQGEPCYAVKMNGSDIHSD